MAIDEGLARRLVTAGRKARWWQRRRDALIVEAFLSDPRPTQAEVAKLVGLSQPSVRDIWLRDKPHDAAAS